MRKYLINIVLLALTFTSAAQIASVRVEKILSLTGNSYQFTNYGDSSIIQFGRGTDKLEFIQEHGEHCIIERGVLRYTNTEFLTTVHFDLNEIRARSLNRGYNNVPSFSMPTELATAQGFSPFLFEELGFYGELKTLNISNGEVQSTFNYSQGLPHGRCVQKTPFVDVMYHKGLKHGPSITKKDGIEITRFYQDGRFVYEEKHEGRQLLSSSMRYGLLLEYKNLNVNAMRLPYDEIYHFIKMHDNGHLAVEGFSSDYFGEDSTGLWYWYDTTGKQIRSKDFGYEILEPAYELESYSDNSVDYFGCSRLTFSSATYSSLTNLNWSNKERGSMRVEVQFNSDGKIEMLTLLDSDKALSKKSKQVIDVLKQNDLIVPTVQRESVSGKAVVVVEVR